MLNFGDCSGSEREKEAIMKLIHLSDLHIGKRVNEFSMIEDQIYILRQIVAVIEREKPDGVLIAGDIYDKSVPSAEAVEVFDDFLAKLAATELPVFLISGNHDSAERLAFGGRILEKSNIYVSPVFRGETCSAVLRDQWGTVKIYLLPFVKPAQMRAVFPEREIQTYTEAVAAAIAHMDIDPQQRNVLLTHQFVTGSVRCESEELSAGGTDNVELRVFEPFDYVALGHLHGPQSAGRETVRYSGSPLKYSFSETSHKKSLTIVELKEKGNLIIRTEELIPLRDMKEIKGSYMEVTAKSFYEKRNQEDYFHVTLTDEEDIPDAISRLRTIYPNIMKLTYDNKRTRQSCILDTDSEVQRKSPIELFREFYEKQNNQDMSREQNALVMELIEEIWEGRV